jgi:uncharacterized protein (TIGR02001 family)
MHNLASLLVVVAACVAASANAADAPQGPVTGNMAITTDYVFRGLTQTWGGPALQGGADYTAASGFAAGFWASSISRRSYPGAAMELDLYTSYGRAFGDGWSWRAGLYGYVYPGGNLDHANPSPASRSFDTLEANVTLGWKWLTLKYNRALTDYFGADVEQDYRANSRGTGYLQLDAALPLRGAWSVALHAGRTHYTTTLAASPASGPRNPDYSDFGASLKYRLDTHWSLIGGVTRATNAGFYRNTASLLNPNDRLDVGGTRGFVTFQGTF